MAGRLRSFHSAGLEGVRGSWHRGGHRKRTSRNHVQLSPQRKCVRAVCG